MSDLTKLDDLGRALVRKAYQQVAAKKEIEARMMEDVRQYHGRYSVDEEKRLQELREQTGSSNVFVNRTRTKTDRAAARVADMLFPTDDKNFGIKPTPNPELSKLSKDSTVAVNESGQPLMINPDTGQPLTIAQIAEREREEAQERAEAMEREIDDQLVEAKYHAIGRQVILDAARVGTGIVKGPVVTARTRKAWNKMDGATYGLTIMRDLRPGVQRVSPWHFFPDMSAATVDEAGFFFERGYLNEVAIRKLGQNPNYAQPQLQKALQSKPFNAGQDEYTSERKTLSGLTNTQRQPYERWEYHGPIDREELACAYSALNPPRDLSDDIAPRPMVHAVIINDVVVMAEVSALETEESIYSVWNWAPSESSIFGYGIPYLCRAPQTVINSAWRNMLDNAAYSVAGITAVDYDLLEPIDGKYELTPRKVFAVKNGTQSTRSIRDAITTFKIDSIQPQLSEIYAMGNELMDAETAIPLIAEGENAEQTQQTATEYRLKYNAANAYLRFLVRRWDDDITKPLITRFYDWNMQQSDKEEIKGDFEVDSRGSSALFDREATLQALLNIAQFAESPVFGPHIKVPDLLRKIAEALNISTDDILIDEDDQQAGDPAADAEQQQLQQQAMVEEQKLVADQQKQALDQERLALDREKLNVEIFKASQAANLDYEKLRAELMKAEIKAESDEIKAELDQETKLREMGLKVAVGSGI